MAEDRQLNFTLDPSRRAALVKRAALLTANRNDGRRVTMSDLLRDAIDVILTAPIDTADANAGHKAIAIRYIPRPEIARALRQASLNSGKPINAVLDELVGEQLQAETA